MDEIEVLEINYRSPRKVAYCFGDETDEWLEYLKTYEPSELEQKRYKLMQYKYGFKLKALPPVSLQEIQDVRMFGSTIHKVTAIVNYSKRTGVNLDQAEDAIDEAYQAWRETRIEPPKLKKAAIRRQK